MGHKFHFPLARLLRVRELEETVAQARYAEANHVAQRQEDVAATARSAALAAQAQLLTLQSERNVQVSSVLSSIGLVDAAHLREGAARQQALTLRFQAEQQRIAWVDARRGVKGLEKLRERRRDEFLAQRAALESAQMDETAGVRHARRTEAREETNGS